MTETTTYSTAETRPMARPRPNRTGFTLIELLIVILIIGALVAILVPTVFAAFRKAKEAQISSEMNNLATALASFKNTYGEYPPSRVILCEAGYNNSRWPADNVAVTQSVSLAGPLSPSGNDTDLSVAQLVQRSRLYMRKFWSRVDFDNGSMAFDFNNNGTTTDVLVLSGSECLTFFLGGIPLNNQLPVNDPRFLVTGVSGFSKSPLNPFNAASTNRSVPNYEFNNSRLVDLDGDGIPSYIDPIDVNPGNRRGYAYFSAYGINSYDPNDVNGYGGKFDSGDPTRDWEYEDDSTTFVERGFVVSFPPNSVISPGPNPYTTSSPVAGNIAWFNPNSYQLLCAGQDRLWGQGGTYNTSGAGAGKLLALPTAQDAGNIHGISTGSREQREADNLTNFSGGRLD